MTPLRGYLIPLAAGLFIIAIGRAHAEDGYTCDDVRNAVSTVQRGASVSRQRAIEIIEAMARSGGAKDEQIRKAKACLK
jgi:hypothetical protein